MLTARPTPRPTLARPARTLCVAPRAEAAPSVVKRLSSAAAAATLSLAFVMGGVTPAAVAAPRPSLGTLEEEIETVEPAVAEAAPALAKTLGASEVSEIEAEVRAVEVATAALDKAAEAVGGETTEIDAAAAPLLARIENVKGLVSLAAAAAKQ